MQDRVAIFSEIITDPNDRAKLAIFNYEFAKRVLEYKATAQDVNDVYTIAGSSFFGKELVDKYNGLAEEIIALLSDCITDENHVITEEEKQKLHEYFMGVAWVLIRRVKYMSPQEINVMLRNLFNGNGVELKGFKIKAESSLDTKVTHVDNTTTIVFVGKLPRVEIVKLFTIKCYIEQIVFGQEGGSIK